MSIAHIFAGAKWSPLWTTSAVYVVMLPFVLVTALAEGIWLSRSRPEGYDWKAWACSLADLAGRRVLLLSRTP